MALLHITAELVNLTLGFNASLPGSSKGGAVPHLLTGRVGKIGREHVIRHIYALRRVATGDVLLWLYRTTGMDGPSLGSRRSAPGLVTTKEAIPAAVFRAFCSKT